MRRHRRQYDRAPAQASRPAAPWAGAALLGLGAALAVLEATRAKRPPVEPKARHDARNLAAAAAGMAASAAPSLLVAALCRRAEARRWGLVKRLGLPRPVEAAAGVLLMDYTLYLWHVMTHRSAWLWRAHRPHHTDVDLTASTGLRFHPAELLLSVPYRAAQVMLIGVGPRAFALWQGLTTASVLFQHSNVRLPDRVEQALEAVVVTPRLHAIHHAADRAFADSNWSSGLTLWDRIHGTLRLRTPGPLAIGDPDDPHAAPPDLARLLAMPWEAVDAPAAPCFRATHNKGRRGNAR